MKYLALYFIMATTIAPSCSDGIKSNSALAIKRLDSLFSSTYPENEPGAAVLLQKGDSVVFEKGYGIADINTGIKIDGNTFFNIASVSKQFSAMALLMLNESGALSLDDSVKKWFPEFGAEFYNRIKLSHLLSHTSGIPDSRDRSDRLFVTTATDVQSYSYLKNLERLNFEPGTSYEYMNPTFQLMYTIIERASGEKFDDFIKNRIFIPCGMNESTYFEADKVIPSMAHGYVYNADNNKFEEYDYGEESFFATKADGGLYTSVREFVLWEKALRNNTLIGGGALKNAQSPKIALPDIKNNYYGYGWFIEELPGFPVKIYHTGDNGGFQIYAARFPEKEILLLIFANRNDKDREANVSKAEKILYEADWLD